MRNWIHRRVDLIRLVSKALRQPVLVAELLLSSAAISILGLASSVYSIMILRRYIGLGVDTTLYTLTSGVFLALLFEHLLRRSRSHLLETWQQKRDKRDSNLLLSRLGMSRYEALEALSPSERREILSAPARLNQALSPANVSALLDAPFAGLYIVIIAMACPPVAVVTGSAIVLSLVVSITGMFVLRNPAEELARQTSKGAILGHFLAQASETLRTFRALPVFRKHWEDTHDKAGSQRRGLLKAQAILQQMGAMLASLLSVLTYAIGAKQVVAGNLDVGTLIGLSILSSRCFAAFNRITSMLESLAKGRQAQKSLKSIHELELEPQKGIVPQSILGALEVKSLSLRFNSQPLPVFENLSLSLPAGGILAVTGPNGSGKTTFLRLLSGLRAPQTGMIRIDGMELRQIVPDWWRSQIRYVPQDLQFFEGTLKENLSVRDPEIDDAELMKLCDSANLGPFLQSRPEGLHMQIQNNANDLPVGIRRRMALVRGLLGKGRIVLLDEPTEGLDSAGREAVGNLLNTLVQEGNTIVIASQESFILNAAKWLLALESGPGHKLMQKEKSP